MIRAAPWCAACCCSAIFEENGAACKIMEINMKRNPRIPPKWFAPAVILGAAGTGSLLALAVAAAME